MIIFLIFPSGHFDTGFDKFRPGFDAFHFLNVPSFLLGCLRERDDFLDLRNALDFAIYVFS
jgi:hypothetical protein